MAGLWYPSLVLRDFEHPFPERLRGSGVLCLPVKCGRRRGEWRDMPLFPAPCAAFPGAAEI